jgi:hypothetical protein
MDGWEDGKKEHGIANANRQKDGAGEERKNAFATDNVGLTASFPPRSALYAHGINSRWFSNPENPEEFGFASSCLPFPSLPSPFRLLSSPPSPHCLQAAC